MLRMTPNISKHYLSVHDGQRERERKTCKMQLQSYAILKTCTGWKHINERTVISGARKGILPGKYTKRAVQCFISLKHLFLKKWIYKEYGKMVTSIKSGQ